MKTGKVKNIPIHFAKKYYQREEASKISDSTIVPVADITSFDKDTKTYRKRKHDDDSQSRKYHIVEVSSID